ncbi:MAG TPA: shikimate dehydrogenase [Xanthobacteraceae bacterium]|nr:shikimate dehydrogenase [Xanthobacteraceae bacterium]
MTSSVPAACVIGWPVKHSRSPLIHEYWLKRYGVAGFYRREAVPPEAFADFVATLAQRGYVGANVTLPYKEQALELSVPDDRARSVGAANTLWFDQGQLCSTNTDVEGFTANLDVNVPGWDSHPGEAVVLGAGGGARAIVCGLIERGFTRINVVNRSLSRAEQLRDRFGASIHPYHWSALPHLLSRASLLVNATSLGMTGQPNLDIDLSPLHPDTVVTDLVYVPLKTPLIAAAQSRGLPTVDGLGMLLHQAVRGFSLWFGVRPEVTSELRTLAEADISR